VTRTGKGVGTRPTQRTEPTSTATRTACADPMRVCHFFGGAAVFKNSSMCVLLDTANVLLHTYGSMQGDLVVVCAGDASAGGGGNDDAVICRSASS